MLMNSNYLPTDANKKLYNAGSEWQDEFGGVIDYYSTFFREYDPVIGRFNGVDPKADATMSQSVYHYSGNNPINFNDPMGDIYVSEGIGRNGAYSDANSMGLDFRRYGYDWSSSNAFFKTGTSEAAILVRQILNFLRNGHSIDEITDQNNNSWGSYTFYFNSGDFTGTLGTNTSTIYNTDSEQYEKGHGSSSENIGKRNRRWHVITFERKLYKYLKWAIVKWNLNYTLKGSLNIYEEQDEKGNWSIKEWASDNLATNIIVNYSKDDSNYRPNYEEKDFVAPRSWLLNKIAGIEISGTTYTRSLKGYPDITFPFYHMSVFGIHVQISNPYREGSFDLFWKRLRTTQDELGWPPR